jgi:hypothetical protein
LEVTNQNINTLDKIVDPKIAARIKRDYGDYSGMMLYKPNKNPDMIVMAPDIIKQMETRLNQGKPIEGYKSAVIAHEAQHALDALNKSGKGHPIFIPDNLRNITPLEKMHHERILDIYNDPAARLPQNREKVEEFLKQYDHGWRRTPALSDALREAYNDPSITDRLNYDKTVDLMDKLVRTDPFLGARAVVSKHFPTFKNYEIDKAKELLFPGIKKTVGNK